VSRRLAPLLGLATVLSGLLLWVVAVPLVSAGNPCFHDFKIPAASTGTGSEVKLDACAFTPTITSVAVGSTVTFRNGPNFTHLITGANQAWGSRDVEVQPNRTVSYTFDAAGTYPYACALHPGMSGVIVVGDVASAAGGTAGSISGAGTTTSGTGTTATASQPGVPQTTSPTDGLWLVAIGAAGGLIVGALLVWVSMRRRTVRGEQPAAGIA